MINASQEGTAIAAQINAIGPLAAIHVETGISLLDAYLANDVPDTIRENHFRELTEFSPTAAAIAEADGDLQSPIYLAIYELRNKLNENFDYRSSPDSVKLLTRKCNLLLAMIEQADIAHISSRLAAKILKEHVGSYSMTRAMENLSRMVSRNGEATHHKDYKDLLSSLLAEKRENLAKDNRTLCIHSFPWLKMLLELNGQTTELEAVTHLFERNKTQAHEFLECWCKTHPGIFSDYAQSRFELANSDNLFRRQAHFDPLLERFKKLPHADRGLFFVHMLRFQDAVWEEMDFTDYAAHNWMPRLQRFLDAGIAKGWNKTYSEKVGYTKSNLLDDKNYRAMTKLKMAFSPEDAAYVTERILTTKGFRWPSNIIFSRSIAAALASDLPQAESLRDIIKNARLIGYGKAKSPEDILLEALDPMVLENSTEDEKYLSQFSEVHDAYESLIKSNQKQIEFKNRTAALPNEERPVLTDIMAALVGRPNPSRELDEDPDFDMPTSKFMTKRFLIDENKARCQRYGPNWNITQLHRISHLSFQLSRLGDVPQKYLDVLLVSLNVVEHYKADGAETEADHRACQNFMDETRRIHQTITFPLSLPMPERTRFLSAEALAMEARDTGSPAKSWCKQAKAFVEGEGVDIAKHICEFLLFQRLAGVSRWNEDKFARRLIAPLKGLIWMLSLYPEEQVKETLEALAMRGFDSRPGHGMLGEKYANAAVWSLSELPDGAGARELARISARITYPKVRAKVDVAMNKAADAAGMSRVELDEIVVPMHGFDTVGPQTADVGSGQAVLTPSVSGKVTVSWVSESGKTVKSPTAAMREKAKPVVKWVRDTIKEMNQDLGTQATRLQGFYLNGRTLSHETWRGSYVDHPFIGMICRGLVWTAKRPSGQSLDGLWDGADFTDVFGKPHDVSDAILTLWHPIHASDSDVSAWRNRLEALEIKQAFRQVWRETYRVTDAEIATEYYSNRFAGHIIRQHQFMKLAHINGWKTRHRMWVDAENDYPAHIVMKEAGYYAEYWVEGAGGDDPPVTDNCAYVYMNTDRLCFYELNPDGNPAQPDTLKQDEVAMADVPAIIFSEIMRHCDLFVSVGTIARDPNWRDRGANARHPNSWYDRVADHYWDGQTNATLTENARVRKAMIERVLERLKHADKLSMDGAHLQVQGKQRSYKIHLGSGAVIRGDNGRHVCIIQKASSKAALVLPFEHDQLLSLIISKAMLLVNDDKITDPVILQQIR